MSVAAQGRLSGFGLSVALLPGWDVRIQRRTESDAVVPGDRHAPNSGFVHPILHAATILMPPLKGDYGSHIVPGLGLNDIMVAMVEFDREAGETAMFQHRFPRLRPNEFDPAALQRALPNRCGTQRFFTHNGRAFCMFTVLGSYVRRTSLTAKANQLISTIEIDPAAGGQR